jgi:predicted AAA+ superfamily ATPase
MGSLNVVVADELNKLTSNTRSAAHPRITKTVDSHLERVKPRFDVVSVDVVDSTVQSNPRGGGRITELIDEKHRLGEVTVLPSVDTELLGITVETGGVLPLFAP